MRFRNALFAAAAAATFLAQPALAGDVAGKWTTEFDTQVGPQKYTFAFAMDGETLTGTASFERMGETGEVELKDCKLDGDSISFVEMMSFQGNELSITYTGTVKGDEIELTRMVGDFAEEKLTATRVKE